MKNSSKELKLQTIEENRISKKNNTQNHGSQKKNPIKIATWKT